MSKIVRSGVEIVINSILLPGVELNIEDVLSFISQSKGSSIIRIVRKIGSK